MREVASFDVFDTCLVRRVTASSDVFCAVARRLVSLSPIPRLTDWEDTFVAARIAAERSILSELDGQEARLTEIWERLTRYLGLTVPTVDVGCQIELEEEAAHLGGIELTRVLVNEERCSGKLIVYVSDSYLPEEFITEQLKRFGFWVDGDEVFISSKLRHTKRSGRLYAEVVQRLKVKPGLILHRGDNYFADVIQARRAGLRALPCTWSGRSEIEKVILDIQLSDKGLAALCGRVKFQRLTSRYLPESPADSLVEGFLGPVTCLIAHWLLKQAKRDERRRLYFASRDARLIWIATNALARLENANVDCRYLYVSRQALFLPSISCVTKQSLKWLFRDFERPQLSRLLAKLEVPLDTFFEEWAKFHPNWNDNADLIIGQFEDDFWQCLSAPRITEAVIDAAARRKKGAINYFTQCGLFDGVRSGYVDLGWYLTCQSALNELCAGIQSYVPLNGYYLAIRRDRVWPLADAPARAIFHEQPIDRPQAATQSWLNGRATLLEHVLGIASHSSVAGYESDGSIAHQASSVELGARQQVEKIDCSLERYVKRSGLLWKGCAEDHATLTALLGSIINNFVMHPKRDSVLALCHIGASSDQNGYGGTPLIEPFGMSECVVDFALGPWRRISGTPIRRSRVWNEGSLAASSPNVQRLQRSLSMVKFFLRQIEIEFVRYQPGTGGRSITPSL